MSIIAKPYTFSANTTISSSQVNSNFDTLYNDYNGGIAAANLATSAVTEAKIADGAVTANKLGSSAVTTAKINDSAVTAVKVAAGVLTGDKFASANMELKTFTASGSVDTTGTSFIDAYSFGSLSIPSWATKAWVFTWIAVQTVTSATDGEAKIVIGSDSGTTIPISKNSQPTTGLATTPLIDQITLSATGSQTFKVQFKESAGTGALRIRSDAVFTGIVMYR